MFFYALKNCFSVSDFVRLAYNLGFHTLVYFSSTPGVHLRYKAIWVSQDLTARVGEHVGWDCTSTVSLPFPLYGNLYNGLRCLLSCFGWHQSFSMCWCKDYCVTLVVSFGMCWFVDFCITFTCVWVTCLSGLLQFLVLYIKSRCLEKKMTGYERMLY